MKLRQLTEKEKLEQQKYLNKMGITKGYSEIERILKQPLSQNQFFYYASCNNCIYFKNDSCINSFIEKEDLSLNSRKEQVCNFWEYDE